MGLLSRQLERLGGTPSPGGHPPPSGAGELFFVLRRLSILWSKAYALVLLLLKDPSFRVALIIYLFPLVACYLVYLDIWTCFGEGNKQYATTSTPVAAQIATCKEKLEDDLAVFVREVNEKIIALKASVVDSVQKCLIRYFKMRLVTLEVSGVYDQT